MARWGEGGRKGMGQKGGVQAHMKQGNQRERDCQRQKCWRAQGDWAKSEGTGCMVKSSGEAEPWAGCMWSAGVLPTMHRNGTV